MGRELFPSAADIPETVPGELYLPAERNDLRAPQATLESELTTTPREVGYAFYCGTFGLGPEEQVLNLYQKEGRPSSEFIESWGNHVGRAIMRVMLDPERLAPFDMAAVYDNEIMLICESDAGERRIFEEFIAKHGVIKRNSAA